MWWHRRARPPLDELQGNVLTPYRRRAFAGYTFVRIGTATAGQQVLSELVPCVTTEAVGRTSHGPTLNIAVTYAGLAALGVDEDVRGSFPVAFREDMAGRAARLGDVADSAPARWEEPFSPDGIHLLVVQYATTCDELRSQLEDVERVIRGTAGADVAGVQRAERSHDAREPFGFRDGVAQPALRAKGAEPPRRGDGTPARFGLWRSIRLGEFVFGYDDADGVRPQAPKGRLGRNGTYVVYRKLRQDMEGFDALVARGSEVIAADVFKAKLVGRWTDGAPLARWPQGPPPDDATGNLNDFRFVRDPLGVQCPVGAHIRRANPRDGTGAGQHMARRHRIIRRGMPYQVAETGERGLVFVCYNVDIERQFELIQRMWLNDGDTLGLGHDPDPIAGSWDPADAGPRRVVIPGERPLAVNLMRPLVTVRGGTYLLLPSMDALRGLSAGEI